MTRTPGIIDFRTPAGGFTSPLELWLACHQRVLMMARMLERLQQHLDDAGADDAARTTATAIRRFFDEAAPRHHQDEELDLFPTLRASLKGRGSRRIAAAMIRLGDDHRTLDDLWREVRLALVHLERGAPAPLDRTLAIAFSSGYQGHCESENELIAPALAAMLTAQQLMAIAHSMARRRRIAWQQLSARR